MERPGLPLVGMVPPVRIELTTYRLQGGCSTTELQRPGREDSDPPAAMASQASGQTGLRLAVNASTPSAKSRPRAFATITSVVIA